MLRVFGCMVASRGGYRMARGWHYAKLSLSNAPRLSFSDLCILLSLFLSLCRFFLVCLCFSFALIGAWLMFLWSFSVQQTTYRIGNHVYYWVWLRPDRLMWRKQQQQQQQHKSFFFLFLFSQSTNREKKIGWKKNRELGTALRALGIVWTHI